MEDDYYVPEITDDWLEDTQYFLKTHVKTNTMKACFRSKSITDLFLLEAVTYNLMYLSNIKVYNSGFDSDIKIHPAYLEFGAGLWRNLNNEYRGRDAHLAKEAATLTKLDRLVKDNFRELNKQGYMDLRPVARNILEEEPEWRRTAGNKK